VSTIWRSRKFHRRGPPAEHRAVELGGVLDGFGVLLGVEKFVLAQQPFLPGALDGVAVVAAVVVEAGIAVAGARGGGVNPIEGRDDLIRNNRSGALPSVGF
jgi:hypothetical protein